jgi:hypothetical protein
MTKVNLIDALKSAFRVFVLTTIGLAVPGLLGWINELTQWASSQGARPFPDADSLVFVAVAAVAGGFVAALTLIVRLLENGFGVTLVGPRASGPPLPPADRKVAA